MSARDRSGEGVLRPRRGVLLGALGLAGLGLLGGRGPARASSGLQRYKCIASECPGYIYDPAKGDPDSGIPPGTPFSELPDDWYCPRCGAAKIEFVPYNF